MEISAELNQPLLRTFDGEGDDGDDVPDPYSSQFVSTASFATIKADEPLPQRHNSVLPVPLKNMLLVLASVFLSPFIGTVYFFQGLKFKQDRTELANPGDWVLLVTVGAVHQCAIISPVANLLFWSKANEVLHDEIMQRGDLYGPLIFYPLSGMYMSAIALAYYHLSSSSGLKQLEKRIQAQRVSVSDNKRTALQVKEQIKQETNIRSELIAFVSLILGLIFVGCIRICFKDSQCQVRGVYKTKMFMYEIPEFAQSVHFNLATVFWFAVPFSISCLVILALVSYFKQLKQIEAFIDRQVEDLSKPRGLAVFAYVWQLIVDNIKKNPQTRALMVPSVVVLFMMLLGSLGYVAINNVYQGGSMAEFTIGCIMLVFFSATSLCGFFLIAVKIQNAVETHTNAVSRVQMETQAEYDSTKHMLTATNAEALRSKVKVLQAFDMYLRASDTGPRILGSSLESWRWFVITGGLLVINIFFFFLYMYECYDKKPVK